MNPPPTTSFPLKGECGNCSSKERRLLHRLWMRGMNRHLCTSCVLRLHPSSFCPSCFDFFDHPLSNTSSAFAHRFVSCTKCSSLTHLSCLPSPPPSPFLCPPCSQHNFSFFPDSTAPLDKRRALILLCACKLAAASVAKSLALARTRVERTVREAALARKRARDALDHCSIVDKIKRLGLEGTFEASNSKYLGMNHNHNNVVSNKKEELNGFGGGQGKVKTEAMSLTPPVNKNGNNHAKLPNRVA